MGPFVSNKNPPSPPAPGDSLHSQGCVQGDTVTEGFTQDISVFDSLSAKGSTEVTQVRMKLPEGPPEHRLRREGTTTREGGFPSAQRSQSRQQLCNPCREPFVRSHKPSQIWNSCTWNPEELCSFTSRYPHNAVSRRKCNETCCWCLWWTKGILWIYRNGHYYLLLFKFNWSFFNIKQLNFLKQNSLNRQFLLNRGT